MSDVPRRKRYPAIPSDIINPNDLGTMSRMVGAIRERLEIFSRDRGRIEDSVVTVADLLQLGLITPRQVAKPDLVPPLLSDGGPTPVGGPVLWGDIVGTPSTFPPSAHTHPATDITGLPGAEWTRLVLGEEFVTSSATAVDVPGLAFAPAANTRYELYGVLLLRTTAVATGPRPGLAWPTGMADGAARIIIPSSGTASLFAHGNVAAAMLVAVGGLPTTVGSYFGSVDGLVIAGATPSGNVRVQLASETAGTNVSLRAGSFLAYRIAS